MTVEVIKGILIPFLGTSAGAGCVFFMRGKIHPLVQRALIGFASGVMVAASIWSLLIPAMEQVTSEGIAKVIPAVAGFWFGILFLLLLDHVIPHLHMNSEEAEGPEGYLDEEEAEEPEGYLDEDEDFSDDEPEDIEIRDLDLDDIPSDQESEE